MITEAIIRKANTANGTYQVYIPFFDGTSNVNVATVNAVSLQLPGILLNYSEGDKVWVAFENNKHGEPVIIGLISPGGVAQQITASSVTINTRASLPNNTVFPFNSTPIKSLTKLLNTVSNKLNETANIFFINIKGQNLDGQNLDISLLSPIMVPSGKTGFISLIKLLLKTSSNKEKVLLSGSRELPVIDRLAQGWETIAASSANTLLVKSKTGDTLTISNDEIAEDDTTQYKYIFTVTNSISL